MKIPRAFGIGVIDIRRIRRLLRGYVSYHRQPGNKFGWPNVPVDGATRSPAALVRKFRKDIEYRTHRQRNWAARIRKAAEGRK